MRWLVFLRGVLLVFWLASSGPARAFEEVGPFSTTLPPDARSEGMGGIFTAVAEGPSSAFWNPGGLARGDELSVMPFSIESRGFDRLYSFDAAQRRNGTGFGLHVNYLDYGDGDTISSGAAGLRSSEYTVSLALGIDPLQRRPRIPAWLSWGVGARLDLSHVAVTDGASPSGSATHKGGTGGDVGLGTLVVMGRPWHTISADGVPPRQGYAGLRLGAVLRNVFDRTLDLGAGDRELLGRSLHLGAAADLSFQESPRFGSWCRLLLVVETRTNLGRFFRGTEFGSGVEVTLLGVLSLRAGIVDSGFEGPSRYHGFGLQYPFSSRFGARIDMASVPTPVGWTHHYSISGWTRL
jgi:hypothetical protein